MSQSDTPRSRGLWWKLPLALVGVLSVIAFVAHGIWTARERAGVARRVAAIRALGEPIDVSDLAEPTVPDAENAAVAIRAAAAAIVEPTDRKGRRRAMEGDDPHAFEWPLTDAEAALLRETIADNPAALAALDDLSAKLRTAWTMPPPGSLRLTGLLPELNESRQAVVLLNDAASLDAREGHPTATTLGRLGAIDAVARALGARRTLVTSLVAGHFHVRSAAKLIELSPTLSPATSADRDAAKTRVASLLDDAAIASLYRTGIVGERVGLHEAVASALRGTLNPADFSTTASPGFGQRLVAYAIAPMIHAGEAVTLDYYAAALPTLDATDRAAFEVAAGPMRAVERASRSGTATMIAKLFMPSLDPALAVRYRILTTRHLAAVTLACRLYAIDHAGTLPPTLDALVPGYLPSVPFDAIDGKPLRYDAARAIVWSVGDNGVVDDGNETIKSPNHAGDLWQMKDAVVHLTPRQRPATMPSE